MSGENRPDLDNKINTGLALHNFCDMEQLYKLLDYWAKSTGMSAVVVDTEGNHISESFGITDFCRLVHGNEKGFAHCKSMWHLDVVSACQCHFGFYDFAVPIVLPNGQKLGKVMAGQALLKDQDEDTIVAKTKECGLDEVAVRKALARLHRKEKYEMECGYKLLKEMVQFFVEKNYADWDNKRLINCVEDDYRIKLEQALAKANKANEAKTNFLFNMSHDIRTPMNAVIGFTEMLESNLDNRELARSYLTKIKASNEVLLSLLDNVLDMAIIESDTMSLDLKPLDVGVCWDGLLLIFDAQMEKKGIDFVKKLAIKQHYVYADDLKVRSILGNILSNAMKYTAAGGRVSLSLEELPAEDSAYVVHKFVIEDTGIGISKEFLPHVFEEFSRERTSTESRVTGTGLGMAIVKRMVDLMGGTIEVESEVGKGTRVTLRLTHRIAVIDSANQTSEKLPDTSVSSLRGKRFLIAEDNDLNAEIVMFILENMGIEVDRVEDGVQCVRKMREQPAGTYDLILMDIQMPYMDGYEATEFIRGFAERAKANIPIVALTANAFEEDRKNAFRVGMNGHIAKPIDVPKFASVLEFILR